MPLQITPGEFEVGYIGFRCFCDFISKLTGIFPPLHFYYDAIDEDPKMDIAMGEWGKVIPPTAYHLLIWHCDCGGVIKHEHLERLSEGLEYVLDSLIPSLRMKLNDDSSYSYLQTLGLNNCSEEYISKNEKLLKKFIDACKIAIEEKVNLEFH